MKCVPARKVGARMNGQTKKQTNSKYW